MIFSGLNYKSIPEFDYLSFDVPILINSISGSGSFGFSGSGANGNGVILDFNFESGKIKDFSNNTVYSYSPNQLINFSGDIFSGGHIYYIDNHPFSFSGTQEYFKFKRFFYNSEDFTIDSNANLYTQEPTLSIDIPSHFDISGTYTGTIEKNPEFEIFSASIQGGNAPMFSIDSTDLNAGNKAGSFVLTTGTPTGISNKKSYQLLLNLNTNFGTVSKALGFTGANISLDTVKSSNLYKYSDGIQYSGGEALTTRSDLYSLDYSIIASGSEQEKPIGVELSYYTGYTGSLNGYTGDIEIVSGGSGYQENTTIGISGGEGSGFLGYLLIDSGINGDGTTGSITGIDIVSFGENYFSSGTADITGVGTGAYIQTPNITYNKNFFETWDLKTGYGAYSTLSFSGNNYKNTTSPNAIYVDDNYGLGTNLLSNNYSKLYIEAVYVPFYDTGSVTAKLRVTGDNFDYISYITGIK